MLKQYFLFLKACGFWAFIDINVQHQTWISTGNFLLSLVEANFCAINFVLTPLQRQSEDKEQYYSSINVSTFDKQPSETDKVAIHTDVCIQVRNEGWYTFYLSCLDTTETLQEWQVCEERIKGHKISVRSCCRCHHCQCTHYLFHAPIWLNRPQLEYCGWLYISRRATQTKLPR